MTASAATLPPIVARRRAGRSTAGRCAVRRSALLFVALSIGVALAPAAADVRSPDVPYENLPYDGDFTFVRIKFEPKEWGPGPFFWGWDLKWNHDYPWAEENLMKILDELTTIEPRIESVDGQPWGGNILAADDPELFNYPLAYLCEPGFWEPTESEARALRAYLLKGGFLVIDDFADMYLRGPQFRNFERQMARVLPEARLIPLDSSHPIFEAFFRVEDLDFTHPKLPYLDTLFYGIFEKNDPEGRLMVIVNYNNDIGDYWEWSDQADNWYPIDLTKKGFQLGVNYVLYGLTH